MTLFNKIVVEKPEFINMNYCLERKEITNIIESLIGRQENQKFMTLKADEKHVEFLDSKQIGCNSISFEKLKEILLSQKFKAIKKQIKKALKKRKTGSKKKDSKVMGSHTEAVEEGKKEEVILEDTLYYLKSNLPLKQDPYVPDLNILQIARTPVLSSTKLFILFNLLIRLFLF
jgi:hypothetical protein